jgi:hypothetical protein
LHQILPKAWRYASENHSQDPTGQVRSNVKVMLTVFFDSHGVVHNEYAPQSTTITKES